MDDIKNRVIQNKGYGEYILKHFNYILKLFMHVLTGKTLKMLFFKERNSPIYNIINFLKFWSFSALNTDRLFFSPGS